MATTIITTDKMTAVRASAIAQIIGNDAIAASKALLIEEAKRQMTNGICHFVFKKKDGSIAERFGTLNPTLCSQHVKGTGQSPEKADVHVTGMSKVWVQSFSLGEYHNYSITNNAEIIAILICNNSKK